MPSPEPLRYDSIQQRYYRLAPGPRGRSIRIYAESTSTQPASTPLPPRTCSRGNPLAVPKIPQNPNVPHASPSGPAPRSQQSSNSSQAPRISGQREGPGVSGGGSSPSQPFEPFGAQHSSTQYTHSASAPRCEPTQRLATGLEHLNITDARSNVISQESRTSPSIARTFPVPITTASMHKGSAAPYSGYQGQIGRDHLAHSQDFRPEAGPEVNVPVSRGNRQYTYQPAPRLPSAPNSRHPGLTPAPYMSPYYGNPSYPYGPPQQPPGQQPHYYRQPATSPYVDPNPYITPQGYTPNLRPGQAPDLQPQYPLVAPGPPPTSRSTLPSTNNQRPQAPGLIGRYQKNLSVGDETVEDNVSEYMVRGKDGLEGPLHPSYRVVEDHWKFFVFGRVFMMLWWEPEGHGKTAGKSNNSVQNCEDKASKHGEKAFSKIYRYVVVRARPKQGYSMCLRISTHGGRGAVQTMNMQSESSIIYTGEEVPKKLPDEKKLYKDPIKVVPKVDSLKLDDASRIHYAKPYPVEHNVKVQEFGMIAQQHHRKLWNYYVKESGYETETPKKHPRRQRRVSGASEGRGKVDRDEHERKYRPHR